MKTVLFISIILASIFNNLELFASELYTASSNEHKKHEQQRSGIPLPIHFVKSSNLLTIYFEAAIGNVSITIIDANNKVVYTTQLCITEATALPIKFDTSTEKYTVYINKL